MTKVMVDLDDETNRKVRKIQVDLEFKDEKMTKPDVIKEIIRRCEKEKIIEKIVGDADG